jgi:hypothetical protein
MITPATPQYTSMSFADHSDTKNDAIEAEDGNNDIDHSLQTQEQLVADSGFVEVSTPSFFRCWQD